MLQVITMKVYLSLCLSLSLISQFCLFAPLSLSASGKTALITTKARRRLSPCQLFHVKVETSNAQPTARKSMGS